MKVEELRKGNYILGYDETEIDRGNGIYEDIEIEEIVQFIGYDPFEGWFWTEGGDREEYRHFQEIPLTEDWLLRLGFDYVRGKEYHNRQINEGAYHVKEVGDAFNHWYLYHKDKMITTNIRFVHQLQNVYYCLSSEELTLKTKS